MARNENETMSEPPYLVAILIAAHRTGDRLLERAARDELERHGIKIRFMSNSLAEGGQQGEENQ